jgi:hypothetical protein
MIPTRAKVEAAAGALFLMAAAFGHSIWLQEHDDRIKAQADVAATEKAFDQLASDRKSHEAADQARDQVSAKQLEAMQSLASKIQTPAEIARWIPQQLGLPQPITISVPPATPQNPHPDATATIPVADLPSLRDSIEKCKEDAVRLSTCQADLSSRASQMADADKQIKGLEGQVGDLRVELKGGTFWKRIKRAGKWLGYGAAAGAVAVCATGHCK